MRALWCEVYGRFAQPVSLPGLQTGSLPGTQGKTRGGDDMTANLFFLACAAGGPGLVMGSLAWIVGGLWAAVGLVTLWTCAALAVIRLKTL